jgi:hypothetical protein
VDGKCRNLKVNVRITDLASRPMLLPVWIMAYRYRDHVFRFLANGQTGQSSGQAPISFRKIGVAIAIAILLIALVLLIVSASMRNRQPRYQRFSTIPDHCSNYACGEEFRFAWGKTG